MCWLALLIIFFIGACWGSYLALLSYRIPKDISTIKKSSFCESCNTNIKWYFNIPIFSYFYLRGKCNTCNSSIPLKYLLSELVTGVLFVLAFQYLFIDYFSLIRAFLLITTIVPSVMIDIEHRIIPDRFSIGLIISGFVLSFFDPVMSWHESASGIVIGGGFLFIVAEVYYRISGKEGLGGGDIKLLAGIGALMGWYPVLIIIFASSVLGSLFGLLMMIIYKQGRQTAIPFGPFIGVAAILYYYLLEGGFWR